MNDPQLPNVNAEQGEQIPEHHRVLIAAAAAAYVQAFGLAATGFTWGVSDQPPTTNGKPNGRSASPNARLGNHDPRGVSRFGSRPNRPRPG